MHNISIHELHNCLTVSTCKLKSRYINILIAEFFLCQLHTANVTSNLIPVYWVELQYFLKTSRKKYRITITNTAIFEKWQNSDTVSWFYLLYSFFWAIPQHLNFKCQHFGTLCLFQLHRCCKLEIWNRRCFSEKLAHKIQMPANYPTFNIQKMAKVWFHLFIYSPFNSSVTKSDCYNVKL